MFPRGYWAGLQTSGSSPEHDIVSVHNSSEHAVVSFVIIISSDLATSPSQSVKWKQHMKLTWKRKMERHST
uniref:Uncharacterized protein n=1 Tax=Zea mays TaxID=4577 RepID=A0A804UG21_MAIZE